MRIAIVVYEGVLHSEYEAFASVLGLLDRAEVVTVGAARTTYHGPGGSLTAAETFDELDDVDVAIVPGGLGCERAADDPALRAFLLRMERSARFVAASSTGTVVLAAAGLLHGHPAATHWLAGDLLRRYGSEADVRRLVTTGNVITCEGRISAVDAAFALVEQLEGQGAVSRIRGTLIERGQPLLRRRRWWHAVTDRLVDLAGARTRQERLEDARQRLEHPHHSGTEAADAPVTPLSVMVELVDNDDLARQMKRSARRRRGAG